MQHNCNLLRVGTCTVMLKLPWNTCTCTLTNCALSPSNVRRSTVSQSDETQRHQCTVHKHKSLSTYFCRLQKNTIWIYKVSNLAWGKWQRPESWCVKKTQRAHHLSFFLKLSLQCLAHQCHSLSHLSVLLKLC